MMLKIKVFVTLKEGVLDPQGKAVEQALVSLGFKNTSQLRVGKYITFQLEAATLEKAKAEVKEMCEKLLANTTIESYSFAVE